MHRSRCVSLAFQWDQRQIRRRQWARRGMMDPSSAVADYSSDMWTQFVLPYSLGGRRGGGGGHQYYLMDGNGGGNGGNSDGDTEVDRHGEVRNGGESKDGADGQDGVGGRANQGETGEGKDGKPAGGAGGAGGVGGSTIGGEVYMPRILEQALLKAVRRRLVWPTSCRVAGHQLRAPEARTGGGSGSSFGRKKTFVTYLLVVTFTDMRGRSYEWTIFRRYSEFTLFAETFHLWLRSTALRARRIPSPTAPAVTFPPLPRFPPKRLFGGSSLSVIKERSRMFGAWLGAVVSRVYAPERRTTQGAMLRSFFCDRAMDFRTVGAGGVGGVGGVDE